jgi:hypothetical protein
MGGACVRVYMNTLQMLRRWTLTLAAAGILTGGTPLALAQAPAATEKKEGPGAAPDPNATDQYLTYYFPKVQFEDATIAEAVEYIAQKVPGVNILVPESVKSVRISLNLRNVNTAQLLEAIAYTTEGRVETGELGGGVRYLKLSPGAQEEARPESRIYNLAAYLGNKDAPQQAEAVEELEKTLIMTVEMLQQADPSSRARLPRMKVNSATRLLIAVGRPEDLAVLEQLVEALQGQAMAVPRPWPRRDGATGNRTPGRPAPGDPAAIRDEFHLPEPPALAAPALTVPPKPDLGPTTPAPRLKP